MVHANRRAVADRRLFEHQHLAPTAQRPSGCKTEQPRAHDDDVGALGDHARTLPDDGRASLRRMTNEGNRFKDVVALVTGAARPRGIGRATALRLAAEGADVACLDIAAQYEEAPAHATATADDLDSVVVEIEVLGRKAIAVRADVSDPDAVEAAVATATDTLGTITVVANVVGGSGVGFGLGPLLAVPPAEFRRVLDVNLVGTWLVTKACASG